MPHVREWLRNDVQHADAAVQKREVVVAHVSHADVGRRARAEEARAEHIGVEGTRVAEARLGADEGVEEPGGVGEVGADERVWCAEEVKEDEMLDHREGRRGSRGRE